LKPLGDTVTQRSWSAEAPAADIQTQAAALAAAGTTIRETVYQGGSHTYTWVYAYSTDAFREWLFTQVRADGLSARELSTRGQTLSRAGDPVGGAAYLTQAGALGDVQALSFLGEAYAAGRGVPVDDVRAADYDQKAADQGNARASTNLGQLYLNGQGVPASTSRALQLFEQGAAAGDMKAPRWVGIVLLKGGPGVAADPLKAAQAFTQAADRGDVTANYYLGYLSEKGIAVPQDYAKAAQWYAKAAPPTGHAEAVACFALGRLYENGLGVTLNKATALAWYQRGADLGDADAQAAVQRLTKG
jgi:hypothetical protein